MKLPKAALLVLFAAIATSLGFQGELWLDKLLIAWMAALRSDRVTPVVRLVTLFGNGESLALVATLAAIGLFLARSRRAALFIASCAAGSGALNQLLKLGFERPRPEAVLGLGSAGGFSFPSGHSMVSATLYVALAIVVSARFPRLRLPALACAGALVLAIGLSRIYLQVHYASDVVAGWALGLALPLWLYPLAVPTAATTPEQAPASRDMPAA
jgi:undecaprenyl-diphosphatase